MGKEKLTPKEKQYYHEQGQKDKANGVNRPPPLDPFSSRDAQKRDTYMEGRKSVKKK
jgi:hypothetical protein